MKISKINQNTHFKGIHLIKVPKQIFENPENNIECADTFKELVLQKSYKYYNFNLKELAGYIFKPQKFAKTFISFENPGYETVCEGMKRTNYSYSLEWLESNSKTPITRPKDEKYHTFYVLTGNDKDKAIDRMLGKAYVKLGQQAKEKIKFINNETIDILRGTAKLSEILNEKFKEIIKDKPVTVWEPKTAQETEETVEKILELND